MSNMNILSVSSPTKISPFSFLSQESKISRKLGVRSQGRNKSCRVFNQYYQRVVNCITHRQAVAKEVCAVEKDNKDGIGIVNFLQGKNFFITGATGFLGKVLVEKLLRSAPDVGKIYMMINARDEEEATKRLKNEIIEDEIFKGLKQILKGSYESFMFSKLIPVAGNVSQRDLNLDEHISQTVASDVHVIVNSAATTTFDDRYDTSVMINTKGPSHLMQFGKKCKNLELFMQISTAYANGEREGRIMEKLFNMGDTIALENFTLGSSSLPPLLDVETEISLALSSNCEATEGDSFHEYMKNLGLQRAQRYGWQDTYVFTKAMGEMMVNHLRGDVPIVIIRPSIIESTYKDPFPGWIQGNRMIDPVILQYGKGLLPGFLADPAAALDLIPADMVVNASLAAMAEHGIAQKPDINIYQVASSTINPLLNQDAANSIFEHFYSNPYIDSKGNPVRVSPFKLFYSKEEFVSCISQNLGDGGINGSKRKELFISRFLDQVEYLVKIYKPYACGHNRRFDTSNTERMMDRMSEEEKETFGFDVKNIDWRDYLVNVHIPGLRRHLMKGR